MATRGIGWTVVALATLIALIKAKAIHAFFKAVWDSACKWIWNKVRDKVAIQAHTDERTYKGRFIDYVYRSAFPQQWFMELEDDYGSVTAVSIEQTQLFLGVKRGTQVEVKTKFHTGFAAETVREVKRFAAK